MIRRPPEEEGKAPLSSKRENDSRSFFDTLLFTIFHVETLDVERHLKWGMVVLLTLGADCSPVTSKPAHLSPYLPITYFSYDSIQLQRKRAALLNVYKGVHVFDSGENLHTPHGFVHVWPKPGKIPLEDIHRAI